ncbi:glycosyltransferase [Paenibacillus thermoaerophilus]|uniref:Glycosyltransferase n=1 Tax=Paenibacillus thermoaerophilus TaxID=1215385 RepID=A0ABW2V8I0_9BACL|nr:glycosyltransferase [Paenibacillus thermoaerophilus]TMV16162.1 glycosyltransferase family 4 protein [Paenibacillus thermoaerophilus]
MRIAIVHDLLTQMGGAERVLSVLHRMFPEAPVYTAASNNANMMESLRGADIRTTWMQRIPGIERHFKRLLPLYPMAIPQLDWTGYDIVISSSFMFAKGIRVPAGTFHYCYCHTPMRFAWDFDNYIEREPYSPLIKTALRGYVKYLRHWDAKTAGRVDKFVANSTVVKQRIRNCYGREAEVLFPPVDVDRFRLSPNTGDYYLVVSRLVPYKRIDLAVETFSKLGLPLYIVGDGPDRERLQSMAAPNVSFLGRLADKEVGKLMAECRGYVFPGEEDFGITPLEANAAGRPVIAYRAGGALDTVDPHVSGLYFEHQTADDLAQAVMEAEGRAWDPRAIRAHAEKFATGRFEAEFRASLERGYHEFRAKLAAGV